MNGYELTRSQLGDALVALIRAPTPGSHDARVVQVVASESEAPSTLTISARARPDADITLELFSADQGKTLLQDALGVPIVVLAVQVSR